MLRPCLGPRQGQVCPIGALTEHTRCPACTRKRERGRRPTTTARGYGTEWQAFSRGQISAEPWCHASPCGWPESAGTPRNPLTTDHVTLGLVLCRNDNSRKQHVDRGAGQKLEGSDRP